VEAACRKGLRKPWAVISLSAFDLDVSGVGRGVAIFGQAADNGTAPATASLELVDVASTNSSPITLKPSAASPLDVNIAPPLP